MKHIRCKRDKTKGYFLSTAVVSNCCRDEANPAATSVKVPPSYAALKILLTHYFQLLGSEAANSITCRSHTLVESFDFRHEQAQLRGGAVHATAVLGNNKLGDPTITTRNPAHDRSLTERTTPRFLTTTTARKASGSDDETAEATPASKSAVPEDLDYYDGLLGQQPGAEKAVMGGKGEQPVSTSDYPIPLPSYLLLAMSAVLSIAFIGSIFEVTGSHPEVSFSSAGLG